MSIGPRLELRQSQQLVMTPQLQQAIKLLQMTSFELSAFVDAELERNPLLDRASEEPSAAEDAPGPPEPAGRDDRRDRLDVVVNGADPSSLEAPFDTGRENLYDADRAGPEPPAPSLAASLTASASLGGGGGGPAWDGAGDPLEELLAQPVSLLDHLEEQIALSSAPLAERAMARALAADVDEQGYLRADPDEAAARLGVSPEVARRALTLLQSCEPTGVGARDLAECLALQLRERDRLDPAMEALLAHLPLVARADFKALSKVCGVSAQDVRDMIAEIRALDPRPGRAFGGAEARTVVPEVFLRRGPRGGWIVELNSDALPRVLVDNAYAAEVLAGAGAETRAYISECRQSASWLVKSLEQRARTILKVAIEIARQQDGFFAHGVAALRPMTLKDVAEKIGMHESTVSRVTAGKHLCCDRGTFELKFFFTQAIAASDGGDALSAEAIRHRIKCLIDRESARKTLSDDAIVTLLKEDGVDIARRTVAKYRESMNIPSSVQRKRLKAAT